MQAGRLHPKLNGEALPFLDHPLNGAILRMRCEALVDGLHGWGGGFSVIASIAAGYSGFPLF